MIVHQATAGVARTPKVLYMMRELLTDRGEGTMARRRSASSARARQAARNAKPTGNRGINFSDIPESTEEELKGARRVGRPRTGEAKQLIAIRISPALLTTLRKLAERQDKPYQTLIHELLERAVKKAA